MPEGYHEFANWTSDQWCDWLARFLDRRAVDPRVMVINDEYYRAAVRLHDGLPDACDREQFAEGVAAAFEATRNSKDFAPRLYYLIDLIAEIKPRRGRRLLLSRLSSRSFRALIYGETPLHWIALSAVTKYDVDAQTVEYIFEALKGEKDFGFGLVCFRALSYSGNANLAYGMLNWLVPLLDNHKAVLLRTELRPIVKRLGLAALIDWYQREVLESGHGRLGALHPVETAIVTGSLARLFPWKQWSEAVGPNEMIAAAQFNATSAAITTADVKRLAELHAIVNPEALIGALKALYIAGVWEIKNHGRSFNRFPGRSGLCDLYGTGGNIELWCESDSAIIGVLEEAELRGEREKELTRTPGACSTRRLKCRGAAGGI